MRCDSGHAHLPPTPPTHARPCSDLASQRLTVRVLDADVGKADDLLGTTMRGLKVGVTGGRCTAPALDAWAHKRTSGRAV